MEKELATSSESEGQSIRCKAAVARRPGEPLVVEEIIVVPPRPREVRIRVICTSFCHSDATFRKMQDVSFHVLKDPPGYFPRILGHEAVGEYTVVDIANVTKIDPEIPPNRACLLGCGVSTGVGAAWRTTSVEPRSTIAIFGLASVGLAVIEGPRLCGVARIIVVNVNPEKYEIGNKFGLTDFVHLRECRKKLVSQIIIEKTGGGVDYCFECVVMELMVHEAFASCRKGWGKVIVVGVDKPGAMLSLSSYDVLHDGKTLMGSLFGGLKSKSHILILRERYMGKELQLDGFVTHEVEFKDINKAFDLLNKGQSLRCVIWMDK